jgi:hypothetical protein
MNKLTAPSTTGIPPTNTPLPSNSVAANQRPLTIETTAKVRDAIRSHFDRAQAKAKADKPEE